MALATPPASTRPCLWPSHQMPPWTKLCRHHRRTAVLPKQMHRPACTASPKARQAYFARTIAQDPGHSQKPKLVLRMTTCSARCRGPSLRPYSRAGSQSCFRAPQIPHTRALRPPRNRLGIKHVPQPCACPWQEPSKRLAASGIARLTRGPRNRHTPGQ